jgi:hypothetical protein
MNLKEKLQIATEAIVVANSCLSDYIITKNGIKIVNQKDLEDAQSILKEALNKLEKKESNE